MGWSPISPTPDTQRNAGVRSKARLLLNMKCICDMESLQFSCNAAMIRQENVPLDVETGVPDSFLIFSLLKKYFHISISLNRTFLPSFFFLFNCIFRLPSVSENLQPIHLLHKFTCSSCSGPILISGYCFNDPISSIQHPWPL